MSDELNELRRISKILTLVNASVLEKELEKYANTPERKKIWVLIDGKKSPDDITAGSGVKQAAVYKFLKSLSDAELIETIYGKPPKKIIEFVPALWFDLFETVKEEPKQKQKDEKDVKATNQ